MSDQISQSTGTGLFSEAPIYIYTQDQAIEDGILVLVGHMGRSRVVFTRNLFDSGYEEQENRRVLIEKGLDLLVKPDSEDSASMRVRVIEAGKIWVIWSVAEGFVFMKPEDY